ncbi:MAG: HEAT repeat domain-containing protein [Acidobacteria bacterium]|nr:HEAT repeat domain-containing protein [Acidobacteriota bacterium]
MKRGIMGIMFSLGLTVRDYRRGLGIISTKPEIIEGAGGTTLYLRKNLIEGMRVMAADKRDSHKGDTTLGMDIDSFMTAQSLMDPKAIAHSVNFGMFMQGSGLKAPQGFQGAPGDMLALAEQAAQAALLNPEVDPKETVQALARVLNDLSPDYLLSSMPAERQNAYKGLPGIEVAHALAEDVALQWAKQKFGTAEGAEGIRVAQDDVVQILGRALRTTQVAERLLQKINVLVERKELPVEVHDRIRQEMGWAGLTPDEQHVHLMQLAEFGEQAFRHFIEYVKQTGKDGLLEKTTEVAGHFFETLPAASGPARDSVLAHLPELIRVLTGMNTLDFVRKVVVQLCSQLSESGTQNDPGHVHIANALTTAAHSMGMFEDFDTALRIGLELDRNRQKDSAAHQSCCAVGLENLLAPATAQKLIDLAIQKTSDPAASRTIASLLRLVENQAAEAVFLMLEDERVAANRSKLLHISQQLGAGSFEAASKRMKDERWYVVRNACYVLGALSDPDVVSHLMPAFSHSDPRVQEAAVSALVKGNLPNRGAALVVALPNLSQHLQESVLNELIMLKDASAIVPLAEFLKNAS